MAETPPPLRRVRLTFADERAQRDVGEAVYRDVSAVVREGPTLFTACDEGTGIERLTWDGGGFGHHAHIRLSDIVDLPDDPDEEMDIEGLAIDDGWLWVVGSQSLKRDKVADSADGDEPLKDLADIDWDVNRQFLGRFPLVEREGGLWPVAEDGDRKAAHLKYRKKGTLRKWLEKDAHLGPFLSIPSKENGLDVEGIVARGDRVWIGLRGPILGQNATILEMRMKVTKGGHLKARRIDGKARVRKHIVDTDGQGIRDMKWDGDDLLVITGPVLSANGPSSILRLHGFARRDGAGYVGEDGQSCVLDLPYRQTKDHPEGLVRWEGSEWLVVYDSPSDDRAGGDPPWTEGDVWRLG